MSDFSSFETQYLSIRQKLLGEYDNIIALEQEYMGKIVDVVLRSALDIEHQFNSAPNFLPFWLNYAPRQRGRAFVGDAVPWGEVGEKLVISVISPHINDICSKIEFPALPFGGDHRFLTEDVLIHLDVKMTGPRDVKNEVVVSPNQVSGDGILWDNKGVVNSKVFARGPRKTNEFQPELPPFYAVEKDGKMAVYPCLTYFIKVVYSVEEFGRQPLDYMEIVSTPNGLIMFDTLRLGDTPGLITPGKDEQDHAHPRTRIKLDPLSKIASWRCVKIVKNPVGIWEPQEREPAVANLPRKKRR